MKGIIDRFESSYAVVEFEGRHTVDIPRALLPAEAQEGDIIETVNDRYQIDHSATKQRKKEITELMDNLWE